MIRRNTEQEIGLMRAGGKILAKVFRYLGENVVKPGTATEEIDEIILQMITDEGAVAAFMGYRGFPAHSCISINEEVVHGIPGPRKLEEGQIVGIDIGVKKDGFFADSARTFAVGEITEDLKSLLETTERALMTGIAQAKVGNRLHDISSAIQGVAEENGFSVVRSLVGHGIGKELHEPPEVPNFGKANTGPRLQEGMVLAIEPMVNMKDYQVITKDDEWTIITADGSPSAHFEHTVAITNGEPQILTLQE